MDVWLVCLLNPNGCWFVLCSFFGLLLGFGFTLTDQSAYRVSCRLWCGCFFFVHMCLVGVLGW